VSSIAVNIDSPGGSPLKVGDGQPLILLGGPCALESEEIARTVAGTVAEICNKLGVSYVFKASFDKANRTSLSSYRGPGLKDGLETLSRIRQEMAVPVVSDIHDVTQAKAAGEVLDIIQIPAFLCRQTDLLAAAAQTGKTVNIKKGQFVSPWDMENAVNKVRGAGGSKIMLVERGASFGYNNLVVDMRSLPIMRSFNCPVIFDATHSVQLPGGAGGASSGQREFIEPLTKAAVAAGIDGLFMEIHPDPDAALCDGPNSIPLNEVEKLLTKIIRVREAVQ